MSYQVGLSCYATLVHAGGAACAAYTPVSTLVADGSILRTVSCQSADSSSGALNLTILSTPVDGSPATSSTVAQVLTYPSCTHGDYVAAVQVIIGAALAAWVLVWSVNAIRNFLDHQRGEA